MSVPLSIVIPAKAGTQRSSHIGAQQRAVRYRTRSLDAGWVPAFAGMTMLFGVEGASHAR